MERKGLLKTVLLLCALIVGSGMAWADTVTFSYEDYKGEGTTSTGSEYTMVKTDVSIKNTKFFGNNSQAHFYANGVTTITPAANVTITKMELTATAESYNGYQSSGTVTASTGKCAKDGVTVTWEGSATSAFTISNNKQIRWTSIVVTYTKAGSGGDPAITASNVDIDYDETSGVISYSIVNPKDGASVSASSETAWISNVSVNAAENKVTFDAEENTGAVERVGTITLLYKKGDDELATKDVKITQSEVVVTYKYSVATTITPGKHYILVGVKNTEVYAMGAQKDNNRGGIPTSITEGKISLASNSGAYEVLIEGDETTGYYTIYDEKTPGYLYAACGTGTGNNMRTETKLDSDGNGTWIMSVDGDGIASIKSINSSLSRPWMRFNYNGGSVIFSCYQNSDSQSDIYLYERDDDTSTQEVSINLNAACTDGTKYYGTYSCPFSFVVPSDLTVSEISVIDGELYVEDYAAGNIVPANTGVMVSSLTDGAHTIVLTTGGTSLLDDDNYLRPSGVTKAEMESKDASCNFYRLTMHNGTTIGFWWGAASGAAFAFADANKAYLAVPTSALVREGFTFGDETNGISLTTNFSQKGEESVYTLSGQKVAQPTKGLYIVNGKKMFVK